jgi:hypothetical protein
LSTDVFTTSVSPSFTQFAEIASVYPELAIIIAIGLQIPYAKPESAANLMLVLYDVY